MIVGQFYLSSDNCIRKIMGVNGRRITYKYIVSTNHTNLVGKSFTREGTLPGRLIDTRLEKIIYNIENE